MHPIGVGDLHDLEAKRRLYAADAPDTCYEPEQFKIIERRHSRLLAAPGKMGQPFEARINAAVFLHEIIYSPRVIVSPRFFFNLTLPRRSGSASSPGLMGRTDAP